MFAAAMLTRLPATTQADFDMDEDYGGASPLQGHGGSHWYVGRGAFARSAFEETYQCQSAAALPAGSALRASVEYGNKSKRARPRGSLRGAQS